MFKDHLSFQTPLIYFFVENLNVEPLYCSLTMKITKIKYSIDCFLFAYNARYILCNFGELV